MKIFYYTLTILLLSCKITLAQRDNVNLLVQSADGKNVKLVWFFKSWNKDITGFDIKRRDGLQDWVKLNSEPVLPGISAKKNLLIVESDVQEESRVKARLYKLLSSHKIESLESESFLEMLNSDERAAQALSALVEKDYDLALMTGFAFVDHTVTKKTNYQYGVFIQGTNILLDSVVWNYGQIPDLNVVKDITAKGTTTSNGIQIIWNADLDKMRGGYVAGFNIYREGIRLNSMPVLTANSKDPSEFVWFDKRAVGSDYNQYSISAESLFGIEGIIKSYTYNPAEHPSEYMKPEVTEINSLGYYFKEGISIKWSFPNESERFLKGFYIEKENMPDGYSRVTQVLDSSARTWIDKTPSPVSGYIRFRVSALYNDKTVVTGPPRIYSYFPVSEPPPPMNFKGRAVFENKKAEAILSWDLPMSGDSVTEFFRVYATDTLNYNLKPVALRLASKNNSYTYTKNQGIASVIRFCISAIGKNEAESPYSDTISLMMPSLELPAPVIQNIKSDSDKAFIDWKFGDIADLKGFRLFQDNKLIAGEESLKRSSRQFVTQALQKGENYNFTLRAVSENGILSEVSQPVSILIPGKRRRGE